MGKGWLAFWAVVAVAAVMAAPTARAQNVNMCIDRCFTTFSPMQMGGSTELRDECLQQCDKNAAPAVPHGAIAFGAGSAAWGVSYGKANAGAANSAAMARCQENGKDCKLAASYSNMCAALATVRAKAKFVTVQANTLNDAKAGALKMCQSQLGGGCQLWVFTCAWDKN